MNRISDYMPIDNSRVNEAPVTIKSELVKRDASDLLGDIRAFRVRKYREDPSRGSSNRENSTNPIDRSQLQEKTMQQNPSVLEVNRRSKRKGLKLVYDKLSGLPLKMSGNDLPFLKFYCADYEYAWNGETGINAKWFQRSRNGFDNYTQIPPFTYINPDYNPELSIDFDNEKTIIKPAPYSVASMISYIREIFFRTVYRRNK